jgi:hypothetical protein
MEASGWSETLVATYVTTGCHNLVDHVLKNAKITDGICRRVLLKLRVYRADPREREIPLFWSGTEIKVARDDVQARLGGGGGGVGEQKSARPHASFFTAIGVCSERYVALVELV